MKNMKFSATVLLVAAICLLQVPASHAACIDVLQPGELPDELVTPNGAVLTYFHNFSGEETYTLSWTRGTTDGGSIGPFPLQPGCKVPTLFGESAEFLLLEQGYGSFCWHVDVLGLAPTSTAPIDRHERILRPLAFDAQRNLLAFYAEQEVIAIRNLSTGHEQRITTRQACASYSGLCFSAVKFQEESVEYRWESGAASSHPLDAVMLTKRPPDTGYYGPKLRFARFCSAGM